MQNNVVQQFYEAFARRDAETMAALYHKDARFQDPAFQLSSGQDVGDMWRMLCKNGKDLKIEFSNVQATESEGTAHWEAHYTFSKTGRKVHNIIEARFKFKDGKIIEHIDTFNFYRWARQSLGFVGLLLGWTTFLQNKVHETAHKTLKDFQIKQRA
jgi:ketosteroid isomerase-like protein